MNFLAHLFLSGNNEELMVGNFIADFVKGNAKNLFPDGIRKGIELHRQIDDFTDHHPITSLSKKRLYPTQHKYAPVVVDLFYDHFLARDFQLYSSVPLTDFASSAYAILIKHKISLPASVTGFLPYMIERNWLVNYATIEGVSNSLRGLSKRVAFPNQMHVAQKDLAESYEQFKTEFHDFFKELLTFATAKR